VDDEQIMVVDLKSHDLKGHAAGVVAQEDQAVVPNRRARRSWLGKDKTAMLYDVPGSSLTDLVPAG